MDSLNKFETALSGFEAEIKNFQKLAETQKQLGNIQKDCQQLLTNYQVFAESVKGLLANYEQFRKEIEIATNKVAATNASFIAGVETKIATFETKQKENFSNLESKNRAQIEEKFEQLKSNQKTFEIALTNVAAENQKSSKSILSNIEAKIINFETQQIEEKFEQLKRAQKTFESVLTNAAAESQKNNKSFLSNIEAKIINFEVNQKVNFANLESRIYSQMNQKFDDFKNQQITLENTIKTELALRLEAIEAKIIANQKKQFFVLLFISLLLLLVLVLKK